MISLKRVILLIMIAGAAMLAAFPFLIHRSQKPIEVKVERSERLGPGEFRKVRFRIDQQIINVHSLVLPPNSYRAKLVDQPDRSDKRRRLVDIPSEDGVLAGINGGYFEADFSPTGLYVLDGKTQSMPVDRPPLSAVVWIDSAGVIHIESAANFRADPVHAFQAGPLLIDPGGEIGIKRDDARNLRRSALALARDGSIVLIHADNVSLGNFAGILAHYPDRLGVQAIGIAVNLDGGPSAGLFLRTPGTPIALNETGPIRNALVFTAGTPAPR